MKEVANCIGHKFIYGSNIQRSLENKTKTDVPSPTNTTGDGDGGYLSSNQNFVWGKRMMEYFKQET